MRWLSVAALAVLLWESGAVQANPEKRSPRETSSFTLLEAPKPEAARAQAQAWLRKAGKPELADSKEFATIWDSDRLLLDKVADTLALGDAQAARLLTEARDPEAPAPTAVPALLRDLKVDRYLRSNLGLAYARTLSNRQIYEEALEVLKGIRPDEVVDPAAYLFHRAVSEHALMLKAEADETIDRLLADAPDAPERYRMVAALMHFDMQTWREKDLGWISRKMGNIRRRLDLTRGGKQTQKMQKEVLVRLDEMIKEMENQQKGNSSANRGACPNGGQKQDGPNNMQPGNPLDDSRLGGIQGKGQVDPKRFKEIAENWGTLPEKERARAMVELTRGMPPKYRDAIEAYFKKLQEGAAP